jgi:MFS family permease
LYWAGSLLSNTGSFFQNVAQALLMFQLTHSSLAVGLVSFSQNIFSLLLGPYAGTLADRTDRRRLMVTVQFSATAVAGLLTALIFTGAITAPLLVAGALGLGLAMAFTQPVMFSFVPELVEAQHVKAAMQMNSVTFNLGRVIGPVLGALTIGAFGYGWAFFGNAVSFLAFGVLVMLVRRRPVNRAARPAKVRDLFTLARSNRRIPVLLICAVIVAITYDPVQTIAPALVQNVFRAPGAWVGWFLGGIGAGAIIAATIRTPRPTIHRVAGYLGVFGFGMAAFAMAPNVWFSLGGAVVGGVGYLLGNIGSQVLLLNEAAPEQSGQMMALYSMGFSGVRPAVSLVDGALADFVGIRQAGVMMTIPALAIAAIALLKARRGDRSWQVGPGGPA